MSRKPNKTGRSNGESRHVRLHHWVMETAAWRTMGAVPRSILVELMRRYNGSNNGHIPMSIREISSLVRIGKTTAADGLQELEDRGFIREAIPSSFARKTSASGPAGRSSRWRLTEFKCDLTSDLPTKEFARWEAPPLAKKSPQKKQNAVRLQVRSVPESGHSVPVGGQSGNEKPQSVPEGGHFEAKTAFQRTSERTVYKLPGGRPLSAAPAEGERSAPPHGAVASSPVVVDFKKRSSSASPNGRPAA